MLERIRHVLQYMIHVDRVELSVQRGALFRRKQGDAVLCQGLVACGAGQLDARCIKARVRCGRDKIPGGRTVIQYGAYSQRLESGDPLLEIPGSLFGILKVVRDSSAVEVVPGAVDDLKGLAIRPWRKPSEPANRAAFYFIRRGKAQPILPSGVTLHVAAAAQDAGSDCFGSGALEIFNQ